MKIIYFGSPDESARILVQLIAMHEVAAVVTNTDSPQKRSARLLPTPVASAAEENHIPVYKFNSLKKENAAEVLKTHNAEIFVVFSYGHIIPREVFTLPGLGTINLHPSLLPEYRGASPLQSAIIDGICHSGISVQTITEALDAGDIVVQEPLTIGSDSTSRDIMAEVITRGGSLLDKAITLLAEGFVPKAQDEAAASYCSKITRESSRIDWQSNPENLHNLIRALNPKPYAWTTLGGKEIKIMKSLRFSEGLDVSSLSHGGFVRFQKKRLVARCGDGAIEILQLHPDGKKVLDAPAFLNGFRDLQGIFE